MPFYSQNQERKSEPDLPNYNNDDYCDCPQQIHDNSFYKKGKFLVRITEEGHKIILQSNGRKGDSFYGRVLESNCPLLEKGEYGVFGKGFYSPYTPENDQYMEKLLSDYQKLNRPYPNSWYKD